MYWRANFSGHELIHLIFFSGPVSVPGFAGTGTVLHMMSDLLFHPICPISFFIFTSFVVYNRHQTMWIPLGIEFAYLQIIFSPITIIMLCTPKSFLLQNAVAHVLLAPALLGIIYNFDWLIVPTKNDWDCTRW